MRIVLIRLSLQALLGILFLLFGLTLIFLPFQVLFELTCGYHAQKKPYRFPWRRESWMRRVSRISRVTNGFAGNTDDADALRPKIESSLQQLQQPQLLQPQKKFSDVDVTLYTLRAPLVVQALLQIGLTPELQPNLFAALVREGITDENIASDCACWFPFVVISL